MKYHKKHFSSVFNANGIVLNISFCFHYIKYEKCEQTVSETIITCILIFSFFNKTRYSPQNMLTGYGSRAALSFLESDPSSEGTVCNRLCRTGIELGEAPEHHRECLSIGFSQAFPSLSSRARNSIASLFNSSSKLIGATQPPQTSIFHPSLTSHTLLHTENICSGAGTYICQWQRIYCVVHEVMCNFMEISLLNSSRSISQGEPHAAESLSSVPATYTPCDSIL